MIHRAEEGVRESELDLVIASSVEKLFSRQSAHGVFTFSCEVSPWADAMALIVLLLTGSNQGLLEALRQNLFRRQRSDGGWGLYPDGQTHLSASTIAYFALLLSGVPKETSRMALAASTIRQRGGLTETSSLTKAFLAVAGQVPWTAIPDTHMELIFRDPDSLLSLYDFSVPLRVHIPALMILSSLRYRVSVPDSCNLHHLIVSGTRLPDEPAMQPNEQGIKACERFLLARQEDDGTIAGYLSATSLFVFARMAIGYDVTTDAPIRRALSGLNRLVYRRSSAALEQQMFSSDIWDTALSLQALAAAGVSQSDTRMTLAARYLVSKQHQKVSDWIHHAPRTRPGGWAFSHNNTLYPDLDDTAAVVTALRPFQRRSLFTRPVKLGVEWLERMQNRDGGFGAFEKNVNKPLLQLLTGADLPGMVTDPASPDVTGRVMNALSGYSFTDRSVCDGAREWLLKVQQDNGSWRGRWGVSYLYGTFLALTGLRSVGVPVDHPAIVRARVWLETVQNPDGGFGESCKSDAQAQFVYLPYSLPSQTAWGLLALLEAAHHITGPSLRAIRWLMAAHDRNEWKEDYPTGAGVAGEAYIRYHSYPLIWPLTALSKARRRMQSPS